MWNITYCENEDQWHSCGTVNSGGTGSNPVVDILNKKI